MEIVPYKDNRREDERPRRETIDGEPYGKPVKLYPHYRWTIVYEDYLPPFVLAFTTCRGDVHQSRQPRAYFTTPNFLMKHEIAHNLLKGNPYVEREDGSHREEMIDHFAADYPMYG